MNANEKRLLLEYSDEELMQQYVIGDSNAFNELHRRHARKIYGYLRGKVHGKADDVFQEVFLRLHRFRGRYDPSIPFLPWIFTITRNAMIDFQRKQRITQENEVQNEVLFSSTMSTAPASVPSATLQTYLENLSEREREILTLHLQEGFSFREIATRLKISSDNARKLSSRAIQRLRSLWT